ncbi:hypothetical protein CPS_3002 [Colwellia psychrerythraea 34H]|uniref:Uncharacterized protein n=1 Tax=Colwellia psychrerythraea (strain 34H / ATCC BAA-681) TaxID=167879 RepID=Q47ZR8_COLP3|nr:hypothetical protein CPS_3002 [Colwellia psychrerythraea 34H]
MVADIQDASKDLGRELSISSTYCSKVGVIIF